MSEQNFSEHSFCCLRIQRQACSYCSVFTDFAACSTPPPPHSRRASTLTPSLGRSACLLSPKMLLARHQRHPPRCQTTGRTRLLRVIESTTSGRRVEAEIKSPADPLLTARPAPSSTFVGVTWTKFRGHRRIAPGFR